MKEFEQDFQDFGEDSFEGDLKSIDYVLILNLLKLFTKLRN